jgi:prolyl-tRNA synthetase
LFMSCYGIGVSNAIGTVIEQNHDEPGIIWHDAMTPFQWVIIPMSLPKFDWWES